MKRTLLDDVEKIYFSIPCTNCGLCRECKNYKSCKTIAKLILSLKKHYMCNKNLKSCSNCNERLNCKIIQKIY